MLVVQKRVLSQLQSLVAQGYDVQGVQGQCHYLWRRLKIHGVRQGQEIQAMFESEDDKKEGDEKKTDDEMTMEAKKAKAKAIKLIGS